jgi:hypothetical protein
MIFDDRNYFAERVITMRRIILTATVLLMAIGLTTAQKTGSTVPKTRPEVEKVKPIKQVEVSSLTVKGQPRGKHYTMDLTKSGAIYNLAADVDTSQVQVRTSKGTMTVAELLRKSGKTITGPLHLGMTSDVRAQRFGTRLGGGRLNYDCSDLACSCTGDDDCNDLFTSTKCGPIAVCYPDGCICIRF